MAFFNQWCNTSEFRQEAAKFLKYGYYIEYPEGTYEYDKYWDEQEYLIENGMTNSAGQYICGLYYFYLNFVMIYNKAKKKLTFPDFWDTDAWVFDEMNQATIDGEHLCIVKARQKGGSLKSIVLPFKRFYFNRYSINYIAAFIEDKADRAWEMMVHMANHLDQHTAWKKNKSPEKTDYWKARFKENIGGKEQWAGFMSEMHKLTLKQNPAYGVGGAIDTFLYDEAGLAPTLSKTVKYVDPACSDGSIRTGTMIIVGSVGELKDCQDLKKLFYSPENDGFRKYENIWDEKATGTYCGLFIPEYYSLKGFIDEEGNSKLEEAKAWCEAQREIKRRSDPEDYRLYISQHPFSPEEAFAQRRESNFPVQLIDREMQRIESEGDFGTVVELEYNEEGNVYHKLDTKRTPIREFPVKASTDKRGATIIYEFPKDKKLGVYFAGVDTVKNIKTTTSVSLASVYIYKRKILRNGQIEPDGIVACYTGRFDDPVTHNEEMEKLIEFYNAQALVEVNVSSFVEHMIRKRKQKYLLRKSDVALINEMNFNQSTHTVYGITATPASNQKLIELIIEYLKESQDTVFDETTGEVIKTVKGVDRIRDYMALYEMREYVEDLNVDRMMALGYALMAGRSQAQHFDLSVQTDKLDYVEENKRINSKVVNTAFSGYNKGAIFFNNPELVKYKTPFRNLK